MKISVKLIENENKDEIIANCPELDINCYGASKNEALRRIKSVIHFYVHSAKELGLDVENFNEIIIDGESNNSFLNDPLPEINNTIN